MNKTKEEKLDVYFYAYQLREQGYNWKNILDIINSEYNTDYKHIATFSRKISIMKSMGDNVSMTDKDLDMMTKAKIRQHKTRIVNQSIQKEVNQSLKELTFKKIIENRFKELPFKPIKGKKPKCKKNIKKEYLLCIADLHYGKIIDLNNNKYNEKIASNRMIKLSMEICNYIKENKIKKLNIVFLGDDIEGRALRVSQLAETTQSMVDQAVNVSWLYINFLNSLPNIEINVKFITCSNHNELRLHNTGRTELEREDLGLFIAPFVNSYTKTTTFEQENEMLITLLGNKILLSHGHQYDKKINLTTINENINADIDFLIQGHYHSYEERTTNISNYNTNKKIIYVPSVCGKDAYAKKLKLGASPQVVILSFNVSGHIGTTFINLN